MWGSYDLSAVRRVEEAARCYFRNPYVHPDRVMSVHDLIYLEEGEWTVCQENETFTMHPGDVLLLYSGRHHFGEQPCRAGTRTFYVHFSSENDEVLSSVPAGEEPRCLPSLISCPDSARVRRLFSELSYFSPSGGVNRDLICSCTLQLLLCELSNIVHNQAASNDVFRRSLRYIQNHSSRFVSEEELARELSVSGKTLRSKFRAAAGQTPYRYQMEWKLQTVSDMLLTYPDMTLRELAFSYGFFDEFHLSKAFKRAFGVSPNEYRLKQSK